MDQEKIFDVLDSLRFQTGSQVNEIIVAGRQSDYILMKIKTNYPEVICLPPEEFATIPELHTAALQIAKGEYISIIEDHNIPAQNWSTAIADAFKSATDMTAAVGGSITNGIDDRLFDCANFICEYSYFLPPNQTGYVTNLPGVNVTYRKSVLNKFGKNLLRSDFWEFTIQPKIRSQGYTLFFSDDIKVLHSKLFKRSLYFQQRFHYSKYYGSRFNKSRHFPQLIFVTLKSLALPPVLLFRLYRSLIRKGIFNWRYCLAFGWLLIIFIIYAIGELYGYLVGTGDSLKKIE